MKWFAHILLLAAVALLSACTDGGCYDNGSALPLVRFYVSGTTRQMSVDGLTIFGIDAPGDSILVDSTATSEVYLPLRATTNVTQWLFLYPGEDIITDTLTVAYRPIPYFAGVECGAMYNFELTSVTVTHYVIDSVAVVKPLVDNSNAVAIRLFFPEE